MIKSILVFLLILFASLSGHGQSKAPKGQLIAENASISKYHTIDELNGMPKGELTKLYLARVKSLSEMLPFMGISQKPGQKMSDIGIPETSDNLDQLEKIQKSRETYAKNLQESLPILISYADKNDLIWAILTYEDMLKRIMMGKDF